MNLRQLYIADAEMMNAQEFTTSLKTEKSKMPKVQTTTKVITLIFDMPKKQEAELEEKWQQHLAGELTLAQVLTWLKKWQVESLLK